MKRVLMATAVALLPFCAQAQMAPSLGVALKNFATRSLAQCPDQRVAVDPVGATGPTGFTLYTLTQESSDSSCQRKTYLLFSPSTSQVLIGTIFTLDQKNMTVVAKIEEVAGAALKSKVVATIAPFPLPDGI